MQEMQIFAFLYYSYCIPKSVYLTKKHNDTVSSLLFLTTVYMLYCGGKDHLENALRILSQAIFSLFK